MKKNNTSELREIINYFGIENQKKKVIEELSELIQAICKNDLENILEEIADVEIMLKQLKIILYDNKEFDYNFLEKIKEIKKEKINKIFKKINKNKIKLKYRECYKNEFDFISDSDYASDHSAAGWGYGYGHSDGYGYGYGYSDGHVQGYGYGHGHGHSWGWGDGHGYSDGKQKEVSQN